MLTINNPITLVSVKLLGFGLSLSYKHDEHFHTVSFMVSYAIGVWKKSWEKAVVND